MEHTGLCCRCHFSFLLLTQRQRGLNLESFQTLQTLEKSTAVPFNAAPNEDLNEIGRPSLVPHHLLFLRDDDIRYNRSQPHARDHELKMSRY